MVLSRWIYSWLILDHCTPTPQTHVVYVMLFLPSNSSSSLSPQCGLLSWTVGRHQMALFVPTATRRHCRSASWRGRRRSCAGAGVQAVSSCPGAAPLGMLDATGTRAYVSL